MEGKLMYHMLDRFPDLWIIASLATFPSALKILYMPKDKNFAEIPSLYSTI
jgi:hypothetical protein